MPKQLDYCDSCQAPIYMEAVEGACSCNQGKLRALSAHLRQNERQQIERIQRTVGNIASPGVAAVVQNAAKTAIANMESNQPVRIFQPPSGIPATRVASSATTLEDILLAETRRDLGLSNVNVAAAILAQTPPPAQPQTRTAATQAPRLEDLWSTPENEAPSEPANDLQGLWSIPEAPHLREDMDWAALDMPIRPMLPDPNEIQFDTDFDADGDGPRPSTPIESARFRVDRGLPERRPFNATIEAGPQGGPMREIGRARGFAVMTDGPVRERSASMTREAAVSSSRRNPEPAPKDNVYRPTVYERLTGNFLDD